MSLGSNMIDFVQRFQDIQQHRDSSDQLIRDILLYCDKLETTLRFQNQKLIEELNECKREKQDMQARLACNEAQTEWYTKEIEEVRGQNGYVLAVIDGDGLLFRDQWVKHGVEGGRKAAIALRQAIAAQCGEHANHVEIVTKVVANFDGLAKALNISVSALRDFALGFTRAKAAFDFIDVGYGKHCVSSKIKENTKWHLDNYNCRHVLLGISYNTSYASFLEEIAEDDFNSSRLTIIAGGVPLAPAFAATKVPAMDLGMDLFRNHKRAEGSTSSPVWPLSTWGTGPRTASPSNSTDSSSINGRSALSYANACASSSPPPQMTLPIPPKPVSRPTATVKSQYQQIPPQQPDWNPGFRGLDEPIIVSIAAMESIKKRKDTDKLCNNHFLRGPCTKGDACFFIHDYQPSNDEINAIAVLARQNPCTNGQDCEFDECIYGHHCPSIRDGVCMHPFCKFPEDAHPPSTKFKNPNIKSN